jgi:hypothetical protein
LQNILYFFSIERKEGFKGPFSSSKASAILTLKGESIAVEMSSLSYIERGWEAFEEGKIIYYYAGCAIIMVGDLISDLYSDPETGLLVSKK